MPITRHVADSLRRKGTAEVMAFISTVRPAARHRGKKHLTIDVSLDDALSGFVNDHRSIFFKRRASANTRDNTKSLEIVPHVRYYPALGILLGTVNAESLDRLLQKVPIARVTSMLSASLVRPIDRKQIATPSLPVAWGLTKLGIDQLWQNGLTGNGIKIAHLDTGVDATHPALTGAVEDFAFFDEEGLLDTFHPTPFDSGEHGTHTAATIVGRAVNGKHIGAAPGATLLSAAVIEGGFIEARILAGMQWAIEKGARVINISLGVRGFTNDFLLLTQRLRQANILPVFAVGNEGASHSRSPGNYDEALSVGASDKLDAVPEFSSSEMIDHTRTVPDLVAPGTGVESAMPGGGYLSMSGTSMAAPHISGLAALLLEANPAADVDQLEHAIFTSCIAPVGNSPERAGLGIPNAAAALQTIRTHV